MKTKAITGMLDSVSKNLFGRSRTESIKDCKCVSCGGEAYPFRDELSAKEYTISGFCQSCQDSVFGVDPSKTSDPPTGKCPNCGSYIYDGKYFCCNRCESEFIADLNSSF